jgi:hypothetical protein
MTRLLAARRLGPLLGALWSSAIAAGVLVAAVGLVTKPPAVLSAVLLVLVSVPYGLIRPVLPALWAVVLALPSVAVGVAAGAGWPSVLPLGYALAGVYAGSWAGERVARRRRRRR